MRGREMWCSVALQYGSPNNQIEWVEKVIACLISYEGKGDVVRPSLSHWSFVALLLKR